MNGYLFAAIIASIVSSIVLIGVYLFILYKDRRRHLGFWSVCWVLYLFRYVADLIFLSHHSAVLLIFNQALLVWSSLFLLWGTLVYVNRRLHSAILFAAAGVSGWIVLSVLSGIDPFFVFLPGYFFSGIMFILTGITFLRNGKRGEVMSMVTGILFILWGLHKFDFPFLYGYRAFLPYGYFLASVLAALSGFFVIHFYLVRHRQLIFKSEEYLRDAESLAHLGSFNWDILSGKIFWSDEMYHIYDRPRDLEPISRSDFLKPLHPDDVFDYAAAERELFKNDLSEFSFRIILSDGRIRHLQFRSKVERKRNGEIFRVHGTVQDISKFKQMQEDLRCSENRYEALLHNAQILVLIFSASDNTILFVNDCMMKLFQGESRLSIGKDMRQLWENAETINRYCAALLNKGSVQNFEISSVDNKGQRRWFLISGDRIRFEESDAVLSVLTDITKTKESELTLRQLLEDRNTLVRELYYRTNTNMQVISSLLHMSAAATDNDAAVSIVKDMDLRIFAMRLVHEKILQMTNLERIDLPSYIKELCASLLSSYQMGARIDIEYELSECMLQFEAAVPLGLSLNEIVSNALKHAFPEERKGKIRVVMRLKEDSLIELTVSDNGCGASASLDLRSSPGLGGKILMLLIEGQLQGKVFVVSENGFAVTIQFKAEQYVSRLKKSDE